MAMAKLVLTLATLAYTCAAKNVGTHPIIPFKQGPCLPESIAMQKFDPEKFFTGTWYERSSFESDITQEDGNCSGMKARIVRDSVEILMYHYDSALNKYTSVIGEANLVEAKTARFSIVLTYDPILIQEFPIYVVDTDYENYAIFYSCRPVPGSSSLNDEMAWTFTRKRGDASNDGSVDRILKLSGLDPAKFARYEHMTCPVDEPTL
uniref:Putative apolipoprotein d/lipocalin n=3 Tax=Rhodnius prolixus TaxID=13249 RepID=R4FKT6_RHOPR